MGGVGDLVVTHNISHMQAEIHIFLYSRSSANIEANINNYEFMSVQTSYKNLFFCKTIVNHQKKSHLNYLLRRTILIAKHKDVLLLC